MTRPLLHFVLVTAALFLGIGPALKAQEPKPAPAEAKPATTPGLPAPKDVKSVTPKAKPKTSSKDGKVAPTDATTAKRKSKSTVPPPNYMVGEPPPPVKPATKTPPPAKPRKQSEKPSMAQRIDINTASKEELKKLPGIFDAEADKIIAKRPYKSKAGLLVDAGLTGAQYFAIKDRVLAGQPTHK